MYWKSTTPDIGQFSAHYAPPVVSFSDRLARIHVGRYLLRQARRRRNRRRFGASGSAEAEG